MAKELKLAKNGVTRPPKIPQQPQKGFTLLELILVIVILGVLSVTVAIKWPTGMEEEAAVLEFKQAVRYAQHKAMTRKYSDGSTAWKISANANRYTIGRQGTDCSSCPIDPNCAEADYCNRSLPKNTTITNGEILFNGLGEPIDNTGKLTGDTIFTIGATPITINAETGYPQ